MKIDHDKLQKSKKAGYSEDEILNFLSENDPDFASKVRSSQEQGYTPQEIFSFVENQSRPNKTEKTAKKIGRLAMQAGIGLAENVLLPYELGVAPLTSKEAQQVPYRENLFSDIERLQEQKAMGQWDEQDQELYDELIEQAKNPRRSEPFIKTSEIGVSDLFEKATGIKTKPEGVLEKSAKWTGFLKKPSTIKELGKIGTNPKELMKAILPGKNVARGLGAGTALEIAEQGGFGPLGTIVSAIVGDLIGGGGAGALKAVASPKKSLANIVANMSNNKSAIKSELTEAAKGKDFIKDVGTLTNSDLVKMIQARLTASGLTGKPLDELRKTMTKEIVEEYNSIAKELGEQKFESLYEAGEESKRVLTEIRDKELGDIRNIYNEARNNAKGKNITIEIPSLAKKIAELEEKLKPGTVKSSEQQTVLNKINDIKSDIYDHAGELKPASVEALMNNKIALNDIVNYEVQGGAKKLLAGIIKDIDEALISYGKTQNQEFYKSYLKGNKNFKSHANKFRNKDIDNLLKTQNPETVLNRMNNINGIKNLEKILNKSLEGKDLFKKLKRTKLDQMLGDNMQNNITEQLKSGKFLNTLANPKNRAIVKELLSPEAYKKLVKLEAHVGEIAQSAQKFFNASQSATAGADLTAMGTILMSVFGLLSGNPWAMSVGVKVGGAIMLGRQTAKLMADVEFLKMVEEAVKAGEKDNLSLMQKTSKKTVDYLEKSIPASINSSI